MLPAWKTSPGAPGVFRSTPLPLRDLTGVRMDVCAFVGVAPRGPAREPVLDAIARDCRPDPRVIRKLRRTVPVAVESFDEYRRMYGAFEGPGLLPYAVASFFEQGGRRAYIARIVHDYGNDVPPALAENPGRVAEGVVGDAHTPAGPLRLRARNEGAWGNQLRATLSFRHTPLSTLRLPPDPLTVAGGEALPEGTLLRLTLDNGLQQYRFVRHVAEQGLPDQAGSVQQATLDQPLFAKAVRAEIVEGDLQIDDGDGRQELFTRQGLSSLHRSWLGATLAYESQLVAPHASWIDLEIQPDPTAPMESFKGGEDGYRDVTPVDFFDESWTLGDDEPGDGITSLVNLPDLSLLVVPDLYSPRPLVPRATVADPAPLAGPVFERCLEAPASPQTQEFFETDLRSLRLDPRTDLAEIEALQARLVEFASEQYSFIVLLDVPPGLSHQRILTWRSKFDSAFAAAYHPWVSTARRDDQRDALIRVPPSSVAAGIIARRELAFGVPHGPANELAAEVVTVDEPVSAEWHDEMHPQGINVFLPERDGIRLTAARTLSRDPQWRQLSVRRLITMMCRALTQQMQWTVFEPNDPTLRSQIRHLLAGYLRRLFRAGAFRGATEEEAFFVRCDEELNPRQVQDAGQVIVQVGVAPAEPLEFIVVRLSRDADGTITVED